MKVLNYKQLQLADEFLNLVSNQVLEKTKFALPKNNFLDKLKIHKILINQNEEKLGLLEKITEELVKNSNLNIGDDQKTIILLCVAAFSASELENSKFLIDNKIKKADFETEIKSVLEELKLLGIGNNIVKNLSNCFKSIFKLTNSLESVLIFVEKYKVPITELEIITDYLKDKGAVVNKNMPKSSNVMTINEFNK